MGEKDKKLPRGCNLSCVPKWIPAADRGSPTNLSCNNNSWNGICFVRQECAKPTVEARRGGERWRRGLDKNSSGTPSSKLSTFYILLNTRCRIFTGGFFLRKILPHLNSSQFPSMERIITPSNWLPQFDVHGGGGGSFRRRRHLPASRRGWQVCFSYLVILSRTPCAFSSSRSGCVRSEAVVENLTFSLS